jgi:hypothetical protein
MLVGKPDGRSPRERPTHILKNTKMNLREMCLEVVCVFDSSDSRRRPVAALVNAAINLLVPCKMRFFLRI